MVHLSEVLNLPVLDASGARVGRLHDLQVDSNRSRVEWVVLRERRKRLRVPWSAVDGLSPLGRRVSLKEEARPAPFEENGELLHLKRDLLDRQIIDIQGRK